MQSQKQTFFLCNLKISIGGIMSKILENTLRLEDLRLDYNLKQKDIANILQVKQNTYSKWENCVNDMPLEKCNQLANFYQS